MPFSALGLDTYATAYTHDDSTQNANKIIEGKYALVVVAENIAPMTEEAFSDYQKTPTPCIVVVPFTTESEGFATQALGEAIKMATGINILQDK
jgi:vacuolar-type H+-ATPase subunit F/Vma7